MDDEGLETMVKEIVDEWDMDTLMSYAHENMFTYYKDNPVEAIAQKEEREDSLEDYEDAKELCSPLVDECLDKAEGGCGWPNLCPVCILK